MKVGESVRKAIDDWQSGELDAAMLHACNAVDGTAKKLYPNLAGNQARFTRLLRENYSILGPMAMPGIDLVETRFPVVVKKPKAPGGKPDLADVIYSIHRCSHGHGDELPDGFQLVEDAAGPARFTRAYIEKGKLRLSDRTVFGLLAVAVFAPVNIDQRVPDGYFLTFAATRLMINDWWGAAARFSVLAATEPLPKVVLDFSNWMN